MSDNRRTQQSDQLIAIFEILKTGSWYEKKVALLLKPHDISHEQFNVLRILEHNCPRSFSLKEIQSRLLNKTANATRLVEKLKRKGYLSSQQLKSDRRALRIVISKKGLKATERIDLSLKDLIKSIRSTFSKKDSQEVVRILREIRKMKD